MQSKRCGFTLTELLVAMALGLVVLGMIGYAFHNTSKASSRAMSIILMDMKASTLMDLIAKDLKDAHPCAAFNLGTGEFTLLTTNVPQTSTESYDYDLAWVRWKWLTSADGTITVSKGDAAAAPDASAVSTPGVAEVMSGLKSFNVVFAKEALTPTWGSVTAGNNIGDAFDGTTTANRPVQAKITAEFEASAGGSTLTRSYERIVQMGGKDLDR